MFGATEGSEDHEMESSAHEQLAEDDTDERMEFGPPLRFTSKAVVSTHVSTPNNVKDSRAKKHPTVPRLFLVY